MRQRERDQDDSQPVAGGAPGADNLDQLRTAASELLAAGDDAIERALSRNSEAFITANRQHGGE
jgi:hypothetical protein